MDPTNPDIVYSEWQQGNLARFDRTTGEIVYIQPQPADGEATERFNWDAPILISPHDPARLFYASQRVWRSDDRGDTWRPISGDHAARWDGRDDRGIRVGSGLYLVWLETGAGTRTSRVVRVE